MHRSMSGQLLAPFDGRPQKRTGVPNANNMHLYTCPVVMSIKHEQLKKQYLQLFRSVTG